ncbi:50S ribosomal protein L6 [PVC group bacterium]|nr:50S ribosomal protein L6 [PVC group bacterium]
MSRIGKKPIALPKEVKLVFANNEVVCEGPKGKLFQKLHPLIQVTIEDVEVRVSVEGQTKSARAMHGLGRALIANMIQGVTEGYEKSLLLTGVGFRGQIQGKSLNLQLGYSHPILYQIPDGVSLEMPSATEITIKGIDKQAVGQVAANIRQFYVPEPYKGKGVSYKGEQIRRKAGKTVA